MGKGDHEVVDEVPLLFNELRCAHELTCGHELALP